MRDFSADRRAPAAACRLKSLTVAAQISTAPTIRGCTAAINWNIGLASSISGKTGNSGRVPGRYPPGSVGRRYAAA